MSEILLEGCASGSVRVSQNSLTKEKKEEKENMNQMQKSKEN